MTQAYRHLGAVHYLCSTAQGSMNAMYAHG